MFLHVEDSDQTVQDSDQTALMRINYSLGEYDKKYVFSRYDEINV